MEQQNPVVNKKINKLGFFTGLISFLIAGGIFIFMIFKLGFYDVIEVFHINFSQTDCGLCIDPLVQLITLYPLFINLCISFFLFVLSLFFPNKKNIIKILLIILIILFFVFAIGLLKIKVFFN